MIFIPGYHVKDKIYESRRTQVYQGVRNPDGLPVIFKTLKKRYPTAEEIDGLKSEYDILTISDYPEALRVFAIENYDNSPVIVMEDFGGKSLVDLFKSKRYDLYKLMGVAIRLSGILGKIHAQGIIHKDINPTNIIWNPDADALKIIDFGISTKLSQENLTLKNPNQLEGTLAYISPEQTGRMNRPLDYRADFYSLGVTFYWMFTGRRPLESPDPLELTHFHIAGTPTAPHRIEPKVPVVLSKIIMKLMAKTAEDRYQSAQGLVKDLEKCLSLLENGTYEDFEIGTTDISQKFQVPGKLYGREKEISTLLEVFDRTAGGKKEMIFFSGAPGIGKSALIYEIHKSIIWRRGYFGGGKFEQYRRNIPYSAIISAFRELLKQILSESNEKLESWKKKILVAVDANGQAIIDVIGEVELIIGKQQPIPVLPAVEAQNRLNIVFQNFMKVFAKKEHPLVIFLDDLQWADNASLDLIRVLVEDIDLNYFLFIGAYRDNEVDSGRPFYFMSEKMKKEGFSWQDIHVEPLNEYHVAQLLVDTLHCQSKDVWDLAKLLYQKTGGNPFYLRELLITLHERDFIEFKYALKDGAAGWAWDISKIQYAGITENIIELLADRVKKLPANTWDVLKIACCIGEKSTLPVLASIYKKSKQDTFKDLTTAIEEGVVIFIENSLKFAHDRVMETAYSLIDEAKREELHYIIGKTHIDLCGANIPEDLIFIIADQWNQSKRLLDESERKRLLEIDFKAGQKAKTSGAYDVAVNFFRNGSELLPGDSWKSDYKYTLSYYSEWSEAEYLARDFVKAEELSGAVLHNAANIIDKIKVYSIRISHYNSQSELSKAMDTSNEALKQLGVSLPKNGNKFLIIKEFLKLKLLLRKREVDDFFNLSAMSDEKIIDAMKIMLEYANTIVISKPGLLPILLMRMVILSLKYGNSPESSFAFGGYGVVLCGAVGDIENGYKFGEFSIELAERIGDRRVKPGVYFLFSTIILHVKKNYKEMLDYVRKNIRYSIDTGNFQYLGYSYSSYILFLFLSGENLNSVKDEWRVYSSHVHKLKQYHNMIALDILGQTINNLSAQSNHNILFRGIFNEEEQIPQLVEQNNLQLLALFYIFKLMLATILGEPLNALEYAELSEKYLPAVIGLPYVHLFYYYYGLALADYYPYAGSKAKKKYLKKLRSIRKQYKKWGESNPYNYLHRYLLIAAEIDHILGKDAVEIQKVFGKAIRLAHENGVLHEKAIACERASKYYLSIDQERIAVMFMTDAYYAYHRWGAQAKINELEEKYPHWFTGKEKRETHQEEFLISTSSATSSEMFDLETIIKASNTISSEIKLGELLKKMMHIVIENAGAQLGYFLLPRNGEWFIEAEGVMNRSHVAILRSIPIETGADFNAYPSNMLSRAIVKYVERTKQTVVLNDAVNEGSFTADTYIKIKKPKSVLCIPLLNQGNLEGILYMENNLTVGAFKEDRIEVLNTLSSQIAISIKNASMYHDLIELNKNLERSVIERTRDLNDKNEQILDSIRYSQKIQATIMPGDEKIKSYLIENFILFLPRDIVSGDFYWFTELDNSIFVAVVDCTGHGVPGALLSMIGVLFLNEIVEINRIVDPALILEALHKKVRMYLKQHERSSETRDGMDVCLCRIDRGKNRLYFAGAKRPLYIVKAKEYPGHSDRSRLMNMRGDKKPIGGIQKEVARTFTCHEIEIKRGDMLYLTTDGFVDQPDPDIKKYSSGRFKAFLEKLAQFPMETQKRYLLEELEGHRGAEKQRDDITIIGIRI